MTTARRQSGSSPSADDALAALERSTDEAPLEPRITSETDRLREVIVGYPDNFHDAEPEITNETMLDTYGTEAAPSAESLIAEFDRFIAVLEELGCVVHRPVGVDGAPDQLCPRDIGFVVGDTFVVSTMAHRSRRIEQRGIDHLVELIQPDRVFDAPDDVVIEGGDVIVDKGRILVGIGQRTNLAGANALAEAFPDHHVVPVPLKLPEEGENVLHLDCAFVPVGPDAALCYPPGLRALPEEVRATYHLIEVTLEEQARLATNVLSVSPNQVISRPTFARVNGLLRERGLTVHEVPFSETPKTGGSFRCATLALRRSSK